MLGHQQKLANITLERTLSQATELLGTELIKTGKALDKGKAEKEPAASQMETDQGKGYQEMPEVDIQTVQDKRIPPGTMKEILVHANLGHKGIRLITPSAEGDLCCIHPKSICLMTKQPQNNAEAKQ